MAQRAKISDVAERAKVSVTTVSLVLNGRGEQIPKETQNRVFQAAAQLNYQPNELARSLKTNQSMTIGCITDHIVSGPHAGGVIMGAQELAWAQGRLLLVVNTEDDAELEQSALEMMKRRRVEGILYTTDSMHVIQVPAGLTDLPIILVNCYDPHSPIPAVIPDEFKGGETATQTLIDEGHRRIAFIDGTPPLEANIERLAGYRAALEASQVSVEQDLIPVVPWTPSGGYQATKYLMELTPPPTALLCVNDWVALGVYEALKELNLRIPDDVAVMGYDDQRLASLMMPGLTTMALPHYQMGLKAIEYLMEMSANPEKSKSIPYLTKIPCPVIRRESV